jgi:Glycosyltransferases involved in cell wall biogenesis
MFISLIIPVYNVEQYLEDCLNSVVAQTFHDYEVICVNDGSTDGSKWILEEYQRKCPQIKIISQSNKGLSAARNAGIQAAKGDYLFFLDSDDWIEPNTLEMLARKQSGEDLICFNGRRSFEDGTIEEPDSGIEEMQLTGWEYYNKYALVSRKFHFVCSVLRLYRREYLLQNNLFFENGIYHEDNLFTPVACYYAQTVKVIPDCLYTYRIREGSITTTINFKRIKDLIWIDNKLATFFNSINSIENKQLNKILTTDYIYAFSQHNIKLFGNKDRELKTIISWKIFSTVVRTYPNRFYYYLIRIHPILYRILEVSVANLRTILCPQK